MMKAWFIEGIVDLSRERTPLALRECPQPEPRAGEVLLRVLCCGVCHTELDEIEGRTPPPVFPIIPGHQVIGRVVKNGEGAQRFREGDRVGVAWIFTACGRCEYCQKGFENLCEQFRATGRDAHGGYAEYMVVNERFAYAIPSVFTDAEAAPLLCVRAPLATGRYDWQTSPMETHLDSPALAHPGTWS